MTQYKFRAAVAGDLDRILEIDEEAYSRVSTEVVATPSMMEQRIRISGDWFIVAVLEEQLWGYVSMQPTPKPPSDFTSWQGATDNGTLARTFCPDGEYVYGAALTISPRAPHSLRLADTLLTQAGARVVGTNKRGIYFSGRMPKYYRHKDKMTPQEYYDARISHQGQLVALDPQIRLYESFGLKRVKLVENGFPGDLDSAGYSVVFWAGNPCFSWPFPRLWGWLFGTLASNETFMRLFMDKDDKRTKR